MNVDFQNVVHEHYAKCFSKQKNVIGEYFNDSSDQDLTQSCFAIANLLIANGEKYPVWQPWMAFSAWGFSLRGEKNLARTLGVISRETHFVKMQLPQTPTESKRVDLRVFEYLLNLPVLDIGHKIPDITELELYREGFLDLFFNDYYALLSESIPAQNHKNTALALEEIAKVWLDSHSVDRIHPIHNPGYEPIPCALAALAIDAGYRPENLPEDVRQFYSPAFEVIPRNYTLSFQTSG